MTDFVAFFFIQLQKTTRVLWANIFFEKEQKRGLFVKKLTFGCFSDLKSAAKDILDDTLPADIREAASIKKKLLIASSFSHL